MLTKIDPLPGSQRKATVANRNLQLTSEEGRLHVRGHIVRAFAGVNERHILWANQIDGRFHVDADIWIGIFVDRQASRRVLNEDLQHSNLKISNFRKRIDHMPGNQMETARKRRKCQLGLMPVAQCFNSRKVVGARLS